MTRYKLPDALGGGEFERLTGYKSKAGDDWRMRFDIPGVGLVDVPLEALTEVKPSLPEEPPDKAVVLWCGEAYQRDDKVVDPEYNWFGDQGWVSWRDMHAGGETIVRLVPAHEPVELPWTCRDVDGSPDLEIRVMSGAFGRFKDAVVRVASGPDGIGIALNVDGLRQLARAATTAADLLDAAKVPDVR